jgi:hypothetical protein
MQHVRKFMNRHRIERLPLWYTENGSRAEGNGLLDSYMPDLKAHNPDQELLVAEYLPKSMIYLQSMGVDRNFFFVLCPYNEDSGRKDWGLMRQDYSVKPSYSALATLTENLGAAVYEGTLDIGEGMRAFLYRQKDNTQTLAYWSLSELDTGPNSPERALDSLHEKAFSLSLSEGGEKIYRGRDCAGLPFEQKADAGKLTLNATLRIRPFRLSLAPNWETPSKWLPRRIESKSRVKMHLSNCRFITFLTRPKEGRSLFPAAK